VIGLAALVVVLALSISTFRIQAQTQRTLIRTQRTISGTWRTLRREDKALQSDATLRKLQRGLTLLRVLAFEWLVRPAEQDGDDHGR
jgi:hypothetical protein